MNKKPIWKNTGAYRIRQYGNKSFEILRQQQHINTGEIRFTVYSYPGNATQAAESMIQLGMSGFTTETATELKNEITRCTNQVVESMRKYNNDVVIDLTK